MFGLQRHGVPSYSTIQRSVMGVNFEKLAQVFNEWARSSVNLQEGEWCGIDGKSIKGTVKNFDNEHQRFISIVSVFTSQRGLVVGMNQLENHRESELVTVQNLIQTLDIKGVTFSLNSLHCQKGASY